MGISGYNLGNYTVANMFNASMYNNPASLAYPISLSDYQISISPVAVTQGLDLTITIKNIKGDGTSLPWPVIWIPTGWNSESSTKKLTRYWVARSKFQPFDEATFPFYDAILDFSVGIGAPNQLVCNCWAFDNDASGDTEQTIAISTDYPYVTRWGCLWWHGDPSDYKIAFTPTFQDGYDRVLPDFIQPGETKTVKFWLRWANGASESTALSVLQPYASFMQAQYPFNNPPKMTGYIAGTQVADESMPAGSDNKYYRSYLGTRVTDFNGWEDLLDGIINHHFTSLQSLKDNHYRGLQLWAISGFTNSGLDFVPDIFTSLPPNLANDLEGLKQWQIDNDFKIIIWAGRAFSAYRSAAAVALNWNTNLQIPQETGYYTLSGSFTPQWTPSTYPDTSNNVYGTDWATWSIKPEADAAFRANLFEMAKYVYGVGFDALPEVLYDPWIDSYLTEIREEHPWLMISGESHKTDKGRHLAPTYYFPENDDVGLFQGRCPLMDLIYPNYTAFVQRGINPDNAIVYQETVSRAQFIASEGMMPLVIGATIIPRPFPLNGVDTSWMGPNGAVALLATISSNGLTLTLKFSPPAGVAWSSPLVSPAVRETLFVRIPHATATDRVIGVSGGSVQLSGGNALVTFTLDSKVYAGEEFYVTCDQGIIDDSEAGADGFSDACAIGSFFAINQSSSIILPAPSNLQATVTANGDSVVLNWT